MRRPVRRDASTDGGFTLAELLVSVGVFSIVSVMVTTASISGLRQQSQVANRDDALAQMRTVLQRIDRDIRATSPLLSVSASQLVLREFGSGVTRIVTYSASGASLTRDEKDTWANGTVTYQPTRVLLANLTSTAVFSVAPIVGYTGSAGNGVNPTTCVITGHGIDVGCVGTVTVSVTAKPPYLANAVTMTDKGTELRNAS